MHIKDLEQETIDKDARRQKRRKEGYDVDSDTDSEDEAAGAKKL